MATQTSSVHLSPRSVRSLLSVRGVASRFLPWKQLDNLVADVVIDQMGSVFGRLLRALNVEYKVAENDLASIPKKGPTIVVANHPFGILDGVIIADLLIKARPDVKILTNHLLSHVPWLREYCIFVDPFGKTESAYASSRGLREAIDWLRSGGALVVFPAGEPISCELATDVMDGGMYSRIASFVITLINASRL